MLILLSYSETDGYNYCFNANLPFISDSIEDLYLFLLKIHDDFVKEHNLKINSTEYNTSSVCIDKEKNIYLNLSEIGPDMHLQTEKEYIDSLKKEAFLVN